MRDLKRTTKILLKCRNKFYVLDSERDDLERLDCCLSQNHVDYLMRHDPEFLALKNNEEKFPVYMNTIEFSFGLIPRTLDQIITLDR